MRGKVDDFLDLNLDWTRESLTIQREHTEASQNARDKMEQELSEPNADAELIAGQFLQEMEALEEDRKARRRACDEKYIGLIQHLQQGL